MPISNARLSPINGTKGEVVVTSKKQQYYLWRAVDSEGNVLDVLLQRHRDTKAANRFFRKLLKKQGFVPRVIVTDKLKSYAAAKKQVIKNVEHRQHKGLNNRAGVLPPTDTNARATDAAIQIPRASERDFYLHLDRFEIISILNNINSQRNVIGNKCANDLKIGEMLLD